jgi:hypothetical protein
MKIILEREMEESGARTVRVYPEAGRGFVPRGKKGVEVFTLAPSP